MATASRENPRPEPSSGTGLSLKTLVIASAGSVAAAVFTHMIWKGGAIIGAAITPIIVALVTETLKRPVEVVTAVAPVPGVRRKGAAGSGMTDVPRAGVGGAPMGPPPTSASSPAPSDPRRPGDDRFGIWQADKRPWYERLKGRPMKIALATGALAFLIGAVALTATELVFGGSVGGGDRVTILPGKQKTSDDKDKGTSTTQTTETTETAPADEEPTETTPEQTETVPTTPQEETPAPQTTPTTPQPTPTPQATPTTPAPAPGTETPAPAPGGTEAPPAG